MLRGKKALPLLSWFEDWAIQRQLPKVRNPSHLITSRRLSLRCQNCGNFESENIPKKKICQINAGFMNHLLGGGCNRFHKIFIKMSSSSPTNFQSESSQNTTTTTIFFCLPRIALLAGPSINLLHPGSHVTRWQRCAIWDDMLGGSSHFSKYS